MGFRPALAWCPWSTWTEIKESQERCRVRRMKRQRLHCCLKSRGFVTSGAGILSPIPVIGCPGPLEVDRQQRQPGPQCQALSESAMWGNNVDAQFALIFGSVIFFVGIMWAFCRCCRWWILECNHEDNPINENDQDENYSYQVVRRSLDGCLRNDDDFDDCEMSSVFSYPTRRLRGTGSLRGRLERRRSAFSVLSASAAIGLPLGADAVSLAQQIINRHNDSTTISPIMPSEQTAPPLSETLIEEDDHLPPPYSDVTGQTSLIAEDLPPAYIPPEGDSEEAPPGYEEATALALPPRYEDL